MTTSAWARDGPVPTNDGQRRSAGGLSTGALLLLPTLNEEAGLEVTLAELETVRGRGDESSFDLLVVDGRSTDGTVAVARRHDAEVLFQHGRGKGQAVREALAWAQARGYARVGVIDADGTYPCDRLPAMFRLLDRGHDVVLGVRRPNRPAHATARDLVHRIGNSLLNLSAARLGRGPILDVCSGFWGLRVDALASLGLRSDGFEIESELIVKAFRRRLRVAQILVEYRTRVGRAKLHAVRDGARILLSIIRHSVASPRTGRTEAPARRAGSPALAPIGPTGRDLERLLLAVGAPGVLLVSPLSRLREATALASELAPCASGIAIVPAVAPGAVETRTAAPSAPRGTSPPGSLIVRLPELLAAGASSGPVLLEVPRVGRQLWLGTPPPASESSAAPRSAPLRRPGTLSILAASLDTSGNRRLLAMLAVNLPPAGRGAGRPAPAEPRPVPAIPVDRGFHVGQRG